MLDPTHPITTGLILLSLGGIALALVLNRGLHARRELSRRARVAMA